MNPKNFDEIDWKAESELLRQAEVNNWRKWVQSPETSLDWKFVTEAFPVMSVYSGGGFVPFQVEGLLGGWGFYLRERHERATLVLFDPESDYVGSSRLRYSAALDYPVSVSRDNVLTVFRELVGRLRLETPLWNVHVLDENTSEIEYAPARGWSADEAKTAFEDFQKAEVARPLEYWVANFQELSFDEAAGFERALKFYNYLQGLKRRAVDAELLGPAEPSIEKLLEYPLTPEVSLER